MSELKYKATWHKSALKGLKMLKRKPDLQKRLDRKIIEILSDPYHYKPLRNVLKNRRRTHIGSFVLVFEINEEEKTIIFHSFDHHNDVYKSK